MHMNYQYMHQYLGINSLDDLLSLLPLIMSRLLHITKVGFCVSTSFYLWHLKKYPSGLMAFFHHKVIVSFDTCNFARNYFFSQKERRYFFSRSQFLCLFVRWEKIEIIYLSLQIYCGPITCYLSSSPQLYGLLLLMIIDADS